MGIEELGICDLEMWRVGALESVVALVAVSD